MKKYQKLLVTLGTLVTLSGVLMGCHTIGGAGEDISAGGKAITRAAESA